jgi:hypothetical protein
MNDQELLNKWRLQKSSGVNRKEFAHNHGMTPKALDSRLYRAKKAEDQSVPDFDEPTEKYDDKIDGNYRTITLQGTRHSDVYDVLAYLNVDLEEWRIDDRYETGSWEMARRAEESAIKWKKGRIQEGYKKDSGKLYIDTLHRWKIPLVRINPIPVEPVLQPMTVYASELNRIEPAANNSGKALIVSDLQVGYRRDHDTGELVPFHDREAMSVVLNVAQQNDFDYVVYVGDFADFSEWSDKFVKEPGFYFTTQAMLIEVAWFMAQMKMALPNAIHVAIPGNHEARFDRSMMTHMRQAYKLKPATEMHLDPPMTLKRMFGFDSIGVHMADEYPHGSVDLGGNADVIHGNNANAAPGATVSAVIKKVNITTIFGHIHRLELATKTVGDRYVTAASVGCLCHTDFRVPGHKPGQNWQKGFGVVHYDQPSPQVELIPITGSSCIYEGGRYNGNDYVEALIKDTGYRF